MISFGSKKATYIGPQGAHTALGEDWFSAISAGAQALATQASAGATAAYNAAGQAVSQAPPKPSALDQILSAVNQAAHIIDTVASMTTPQAASTRAAAAQAYPAGTITAYFPALGKWRIAIPVSMATLGAPVSDYHGCKSDEVWSQSKGRCRPKGFPPPVPKPKQGLGNCYGCGLGAGGSTFVEAASTLTPVPGVTQVTTSAFQKQLDELAFYQKTTFWVIASVAVVALGTGTYLIMRRRKQ